MTSKLGDQILQSKPNSLEHLQLVKIIDVLLAENDYMHEELEKLRAAGEDRTIYPENAK